MRKMTSIMAAVALVASPGTQGVAQTLDPPVVAQEVPDRAVTGSLGPTEILITVLALLMVWAAYDQNDRANAD
ncbi:hypothetical protein [Yoonia sp.]|uniref:hypothetical protein n=1 Tax=Yoonia sp. TaxID=2212373 RepID=UPI002FDA5B45